jgi:hypothetical protein
MWPFDASARRAQPTRNVGNPCADASTAAPGTAAREERTVAQTLE